MLAVNCLLKNTQAVKHIKDAIEMLVGDYIDRTGNARFQDIYYDLRKMKLEVDAESVGEIYNGLYGGLEDSAVSTTEEVEEFTGKAFRKQMKSIVDNIVSGPPSPQVVEIGNDSPEKFAVNAIAKMFQAETFGATPKVATAMKQMQDLVTKAATTLLPKTAKPATTLTEALKNFFDVESNQFRTLNGTVNTLETLTNAVKQQVADYVDTAAESMTEDEADLFRQVWNNYTKDFMDSSYDILLNKGNQNSLVNQSLQQVKIDGVNIVDINGNVKWSALLEYGNPDSVAEKITQLFKDGFKDTNGQTVKFDDKQAERIGDYFRRIYVDKLETARQRAAQNNRVRNKSAKNIVSDFIKDRGFFNTVKDKNGKLLLTQTDWTDAIRYIKNQMAGMDIGADKKGAAIRGLDLVQDKLKKFLARQRNPDGSQKFTPDQQRLIEDEFVRTALAKLIPATRDADSMERLIALDQLNNSKAFREETQQALNKVVGVSGLNQNTLNQIQQLAKTAQLILQGAQVNIPGQPASVNRAAYAYTALVEVDRRIKEILREHKIDSSSTQRVVKYVSDILGGGTISLLLNPNNMVENVVTQTGTNVAESFNMLFTNPKLFFKTWGKLQGDFWTQWTNYAQGGASNEIANESDLSSDLQSSERLRVRGAMNEFKDKPFFSALGSVILKSPAYAMSIASRALMNSFDAATTTSLMRKKLLQTTYTSLVNQGNSSTEVLALMDKAFNIPPNIDAEIKAENKRIETVLMKAGIPVNRIMMAQNERDMRMSVYEDVIRDQAAVSGASIAHSAEITKTLIEASQNVAKELGGKRQIPTKDVVSLGIYGLSKAILIPQKALFEKTRMLEAKGNLKSAARWQLSASLYQNFIGKFVGGVANFMNLAFSATPLGFFIAGSLYSQRQNFLGDHPEARDVFNADPEIIKKYAELNAITKSITTRATMGSLAMAAFIAKALIGGVGSDDDDSEDWFHNLMKTKTGRRFAQKHLPIGIALTAPLFYQKKGKASDTQLTMMADMFDVYTGKDFSAYSNLMRSLKYAKTDEERHDVWSKFAGGMVTSYNVNQPEQTIRFLDAINGIFDKNKIGVIKDNEEISKEIYKQTEGVVDNFLINGAIDAIRRTIDEHQHYNRFVKRPAGAEAEY
jgi:hypothetical protein